MRSTEAPVRSRACSSSLRAWLSSASLLGTGCGDTGHQRKAAGTMSAYQSLTLAKHGHTVGGRQALRSYHHTLAMRRDVLVPEFLRVRGPPEEAGIGLFAGCSESGETRTRTGDTTI